MSKKTNLVIVESLAKAKTIEKYLNASKVLSPLGSFKVVASFGHIDNLPSKELGIDIENDFKIQYQHLPDKKKLIDELKTKAKACDIVWLASDADFEGEKIADSLCSTLRLKTYKRITFTEITQRALEHSFQNPRQIDRLLVDAQETRRILDRLVGYKISPLLWKTYTTTTGKALSAGRVQSAVMHIIIQRENDIAAFKSQSYWYFIGSFILHEKKDTSLNDVKLYHDGTILKLDSKKDAYDILRSLKNDFRIQEIKAKVSKQYPDAPYVTSSFQQDAYSKLGMSLKRSMQIAQELYENGYITYMRTDSCALSADFKNTAEEFVIETYGKEYWEGKTKVKKSKNAQEAHEAIRPTHIETKELPNTTSFTNDHKNVYEMIWKRTVASLMKPCEYNELHIQIVDTSMVSTDMYFLANIKKVKWNGFQIVYGLKNDIDDMEKLKNSIKGVSCIDILAKNTWSNPPSRFNESSLVKVMEQEGIGRPSTYSSTIQKLVDKSYIIKSDIAGEKRETRNILYVPKKQLQEQISYVEVGDEKSKMVPTSIGKEIDLCVEKWFSYIVDSNFTSLLEKDLDKIAEGTKKKMELLNTFWETFKKDISTASKEIKQTHKTTLKTESNIINVDGHEYNVRIAKFGPVIEYQKDGAKAFIGLQQYLKYMKKEYLDIDEDDIRFLIKLPIKVRGVNGEEANCLLGPYGLYLKTSTSNHKIPMFAIQDFIKSGGKMEATIVTKILEYKPNTKDKKNDNVSKVITTTSTIKKGRKH